MNKKAIILLIFVVLLLSGCVPQIPSSNDKSAEEESKELIDNVCIDNNGNGICDKNEVPARVNPVVVEPVQELPSEFLDVMENQDKIESYSYIKKVYEDGLESVSIKDKYEIFFNDGNMKQLFSAKIYYVNNNILYEYNNYKNESYVKSNSMVKENTLMGELEDAENLVVEKSSTKYGSYGAVIVNYEKNGDFYRVTIWEYYGVPLLVEINNQDNEGDIIRYEVEINKVTEEDVVLPNSVIVE